MLASADNAAALHAVDCAPGPRRPVAQRLDYSHPASVVLQREVRPAQAHAAVSGSCPVDESQDMLLVDFARSVRVNLAG